MIKGFDDQFRMQRLGKIRLGVKKKTGGGKEYPSAVDYFVCPEEVKEVYGDKPRELDIMIPHDDIEEVFPTALKMYGSQQGLKCTGDGETARRRIKDTNDWEDIECGYKDCKYYKKGHCTEVGNLQVILPKVKGMLGIYQIDTSSYHSTLNIKSSIQMLKQTLGRCSLIPLKLEVRMQQANPMTSNGRIKTTVPVMFMKLNHTFYEVIDMAKERKLIKQVNVQGGSDIQLDNPDIDEKPELLYDVDEQEESPEEDMNEADVEIVEDGENNNEEENEEDEELKEKLHEAWDKLGTPKAKRKAVLGKPDLDKEQLLEKLKYEIARRDFESKLDGEENNEKEPVQEKDEDVEKVEEEPKTKQKQEFDFF